MKSSFFRVVTLVSALGMLVVAAAAQERGKVSSAASDKYVISAKAGGVGYISGDATIARASGRGGALLKRDEIEIGDRVSTGAAGRIEVLLNPGSFMRVGPNSSFEFKSTSLDDLKIQMTRGSAFFEVYADKEFKVAVLTPDGTISLIETGIYRVDVSDSGVSSVAVYNGKAETQLGKENQIKKGKIGTLDGGVTTVAKFDRDDRGELGDWSKERSKELAKATNSLKNRDMRDSLLSSFNMGRWNMYNSFGLWVFDRFSMGYCFLPFGYDWYSPYGYGYGPGLYWYRLPRFIYQPPVNGPIRIIRVDPTARTRTTDRQTTNDRRAEPPFQTVGPRRDTDRNVFPDPNSRQPREISVPIIVPPVVNTDRRPKGDN